MKENELYVVKEHKIDNPLTTDTDSMLEICFIDCLDNYFHEFKSRRYS